MPNVARLIFIMYPPLTNFCIAFYDLLFCKQKGAEIIEAEVYKDHIHMHFALNTTNIKNSSKFSFGYQESYQLLSDVKKLLLPCDIKCICYSLFKRKVKIFWYWLLLHFTVLLIAKNAKM